MKTLNPNFREDLQNHPEKNRFTQHIGFNIVQLSEGYAEGYLDIEERHRQHTDFVHGGVTATVADIATGLACYTLLARDTAAVTAEIKISYLNPGTTGRLKAVGRVIKQGRKFNFCEAEVINLRSDGEEVLIAKASATMAVIDKDDILRAGDKE